MPIKKRDGTEYRLNHPNPLVDSQELFETSKLLFHNFEKNSTIIPDNSVLIPQKFGSEETVEDYNDEKGVEISIKINTNNEILEIEPEIIENSEDDEILEIESDLVEEEFIEDVQTEKESSEEFNQNILDRDDIIVAHCLPAFMKNYKDSLYGEGYSKVEYEKQFTVEALILQDTGMVLIVWTGIELKKESIIYPSHYSKSKRPLQEKRWWKVNTVEEDGGGYIYTCLPSEETPSFI